jgi:hypothetical protein
MGEKASAIKNDVLRRTGGSRAAAVELSLAGRHSLD